MTEIMSLEEGPETERFRAFPELIIHEGLRQLAQAWTDRFLTCGGIPTRRQLDPSDFPRALSRVWYLKYMPEEEEFNFVLVGNEIAEAMGQYPKGKALSSVYSSKDYSYIRSFLDVSLNTPAMVYGSGLFNLASVDGARFERLCLPFSLSGTEIDCVIGGTAFTTPMGGAQNLLEENMESREVIDLSGYSIATDFNIY